MELDDCPAHFVSYHPVGVSGSGGGHHSIQKGDEHFFRVDDIIYGTPLSGYPYSADNAILRMVIHKLTIGGPSWYYESRFE